MIVRKSPLSVNQPIDIMDGPHSYSSRVEEIEASRVVVAAPVSEGLVVHLPVGVWVTVICLRTDPVGAGRYEGDTRVVGHGRGQPPLLYLENPATWRKIQLRNFVRTEAVLPISYRVIQEEGAVTTTSVRAETRDISGGGVRLIQRQPLDEGTMIEIFVKLPEGSVAATGIVEWAGIPGAAVPKPGEPRDIGVRFDKIDERDRDRIVRFVFQKQAELRRKGLV